MKKVNKYSLICEGKMEEQFIYYLKNNIYKNNKLSLCRNHSKVINGTLSCNDIKEAPCQCCRKYLIIDKDNLNDKNLMQYKKISNKCNVTLIVNIPCLEVLLLAIFSNSFSIHDTKKEIENKLNTCLKKYSKNYTHNLQSLEWILLIFKNNYTLQKQFDKNLMKLQDEKISNFFILNKTLKGENNV